VTKPRIPLVATPPPDEDPTGVRALLSSLPAPDPMPEHLVERINASLAAEQAQRAAGSSGDTVSPLLATRRPRRGRLVFALAGAAATVALVTVVSSGLLNPAATTTSANRVSTSTSTPRGDAAAPEAASGAKLLTPAAGPSAGSDGLYSRKDSAAAPPAGAARAAASGGALVQIRESGTRYTQSDFLGQAQTLSGSTQVSNPLVEAVPSEQPVASKVGPAGTAGGLTACLSALGAGEAQLVWADVATYEGRPAVVIVAITKSKPVAYVVGPQCSMAHPEVLRPATPLP
jgi:hypothetical protein